MRLCDASTGEGEIPYTIVTRSTDVNAYYAYNMQDPQQCNCASTGDTWCGDCVRIDVIDESGGVGVESLYVIAPLLPLYCSYYHYLLLPLLLLTHLASQVPVCRRRGQSKPNGWQRRRAGGLQRTFTFISNTPVVLRCLVILCFLPVVHVLATTGTARSHVPPSKDVPYSGHQSCSP